MSAAAEREQRLVLVIDDDAGVRTVVAWQLESAGFAVAQAEGGTQAIASLGTTRPDLLVLDLSLPGIGGLDVLRSIRDGETAAPAGQAVLAR